MFNRLAWQNGTLLDERERPGSIAERRAQLDRAHIGPLHAWATSVAERTGEKVPAFDPRSGGIQAQVLFLLQDPSAVADGSGFISIDNNDQTAHNCTKAYEASGLDYQRALHWNVIPWWVKDPDQAHQPRRTFQAQAHRAGTYLVELVGLLPNLELVVLLGKEAQRAWDAAAPLPIATVRCPHPSNLAWNRLDQASGRIGREATIGAFRRAKEVIESADAPERV
ncbi:uracil-DNA glycosylase [Aeromicrobium camelliae]|uniref:uracil-DNA glycosylase n=1 Tax=Aeromicrobium camelliae TaxID=1538144 RepID=UPI00140B137F|nr:uracil-DNA glycosylase [Aeromicrobium camelliae]